MIINTINIRSCDQSPGLNARKVWEALFREVKGEQFPTLDSFLCDLKSFEEILKTEKQFWWSYDVSGWTNTTLFEDPFDTSKKQYKITIFYNDRIEISNESQS